MTAAEALRTLRANRLCFGAMMPADGLVAGSLASTPDVLRAAFHCVGTAPGIKLASACFLMDLRTPAPAGDETLVYADSGVNPCPDAGQLVDIARATAATCANGCAARCAPPWRPCAGSPACADGIPETCRPSSPVAARMPRPGRSTAASGRRSTRIAAAAIRGASSRKYSSTTAIPASRLVSRAEKSPGKPGSAAFRRPSGSGAGAPRRPPARTRSFRRA